MWPENVLFDTKRFEQKLKKDELETEETTTEQICKFNYLRKIMRWREYINMELKILEGIIKYCIVFMWSV